MESKTVKMVVNDLLSADNQRRRRRTQYVTNRIAVPPDLKLFGIVHIEVFLEERVRSKILRHAVKIVLVTLLPAPFSVLPLPFRFAVPVSRCRFWTPLPLPLPLRIFLPFTAVTERNFLT